MGVPVTGNEMRDERDRAGRLIQLKGGPGIVTAIPLVVPRTHADGHSKRSPASLTGREHCDAETDPRPEDVTS